jgi:CheY-like chemotaxis protein
MGTNGGAPLRRPPQDEACFPHISEDFEVAFKLKPQDKSNSDTIPHSVPEFRKLGGFSNSTSGENMLDGSGSRTITILLVDDSHFFRNYIKRLFALVGHAVIEATDGQQAWNFLSRGQHVDCVVTNAMMPIMSGFDLCRKIKQHPVFRHLPVIALTSLSHPDDETAGKNAGVDSYQVKIDQDKLLAAIDHLLPRQLVG